MARSSGFSAQTLRVLASLESDPVTWRHGYLLARETGLRSGTLYPILIRLAERGLVEACWEDGSRPDARDGTCTGSAPKGWPRPGRPWPGQPR